MMMANLVGRSFFLSSLVLFFLFSTACIRRTPSSVPEMHIFPNFGVEHVVRLDENEQQTLARAPYASQKVTVDDSDLKAMRFTFYLDFKKAGIRAYFRDGLINLIEIEEPFNGTLLNKRLHVFDFVAAPAGKTWEEILTRELGKPLLTASGGSLGSFAMFYNWGDVSYNESGPNQVAIYRDLNIGTNYRRKNFGRKLKFFQK